MNKHAHWRPSGTRNLVAPELAAGLEILPDIELNAEILAEVRAEMTFVPSDENLTPAQKAVNCRDVFVPGLNSAPDIRVVLYTPSGDASGLRPAYLHIHGGGYVSGHPGMSDQTNRQLVHTFGCVVASVDYRWAPETPWPGSLEDNYAALLWLHSQADELSIDTSRIAIGGESAGGGHAAALVLHARDRGEVPVCLQLLDSPMLDDRTGAGSDHHPYCGEFVWTPASNRFGWQSLLGMEPGGDDVPQEAVPSRRTDLAGLPPTLIIVGALDLFCEEDIEYARRLIRAGVQTELYVVPGAYHGFSVLGLEAPQVQAVDRLRNAAFARAWS